jgi:hypothetical protein
MTRLDLLKLIIGRARANGFEFRRWYTARLALPWTSADDAFVTLEQHRLYYALLFSTDFAQAFWKPGAEMTFQVPAQTFPRRMPDGTIKTIARKPFTRRSARKDAWRYHLREMALAEEPLRYIRRYLNVEEDLAEEPPPAPDSAASSAPPSAHPSAHPKTGRPRASQSKSQSKPSRPLPAGPPAFLRRPYP